MEIKVLARCTVLGLFLILLGCASYIPPSGGQTANVQGSILTKGYKVIILEINGEPLVGSAKKYTGMYYEPQPDDKHAVRSGKCTIKVQAYTGPTSHGLVTGWSTRGTVLFVAEAGKNYSVRAKIDDNILVPDQAEFYVVEIR